MTKTIFSIGKWYSIILLALVLLLLISDCFMYGVDEETILAVVLYAPIVYWLYQLKLKSEEEEIEIKIK